MALYNNGTTDAVNSNPFMVNGAPVGVDAMWNIVKDGWHKAIFFDGMFTCFNENGEPIEAYGPGSHMITGSLLAIRPQSKDVQPLVAANYEHMIQQAMDGTSPILAEAPETELYFRITGSNGQELVTNLPEGSFSNIDTAPKHQWASTFTAPVTSKPAEPYVCNIKVYLPLGDATPCLGYYKVKVADRTFGRDGAMVEKLMAHLHVYNHTEYHLTFHPNFIAWILAMGFAVQAQ